MRFYSLLVLAALSLTAYAAPGGPRVIDGGVIRNGSATLTLPTTSTTMVGTGTTNTLTNKDIDGGTASNASRVTLPKGPTATLSGLTRKQGTILYDTTKNKAVIDDGSTLVAVGSGSGSSSDVGTNTGFEDGTTGWTASGGTFTTTTTAADLGSLTTSGSWDSSSAGQTLTNTAVTITSGDGLSGQNGAASCRFKAASGTATHLIQAYDGTNILGSATITSSTAGYVRASVNFPFPASGTTALRVISVASNEPILYIDDCYLGLAEGFNVSQVSQATLYGSIAWPVAASCQWATNGSYGAIAADADCTTPTGSALTANATAPATKIPAIRFASYPAGEYLIIASSKFLLSGGTADAAWQFYDGTNASAISEMRADTASVSNGQMTVIGRILNTTDRSNVDIVLRGKSVSGSGSIDLSGEAGLSISVYRFPLAPETAYRPDVLPASWSGYHDSDCSFNISNATGNFLDTGVDATCTFAELPNRNQNFGTVTSYLSGSDKLPGIVITPKRAGRFLVIATATTEKTLDNGEASYELSTTEATPQVLDEVGIRYAAGGSGATYAVPLNGIVYASSTTPITVRIRHKTVSANTAHIVTGGTTNGNKAIVWKVIALDQSFPSPNLVGSVTSNSSGIERLERANVLNSGSCAVNRQSGTWITGVSDPGAGKCTMTITGFSETPDCVCSAQNEEGAFCSVSLSSSTSITTTVTTHGGTNVDYPFSIHCMGPR